MTTSEIAGTHRPLRLGTRKSPLAMAQAEMTAAALRNAHGWRTEQIELVPVIATGDKILDRPLADIGGKALWTKELDAALAEGAIDAAVHSMKDVETDRPDIFLIAAMLPRADVRDRLVGAERISALRKGAIVGTASPRRRAQLLAQRPDLDIRLIRGNVQTRLAKVESGEFAATLLAAAGLDRLGMADTGHALDITEMLPAASQGAIGIECLRDAADVRRLLGAVDDRTTHLAVAAERAFLAGLGADCHSPVAVHATPADGELQLTAQLLSPDGDEELRDVLMFQPADVRAPGIFARAMLGKAHPAIRACFAGSDG
ncbi:MAG: hydroxymethylbilane synthase [Parasphingorhabdus sp.]|nr:hydroxymethylbilane synthase [Parasphingorhabdus sp.]